MEPWMEPLSPFEDVAGTEVCEDGRELLSWDLVEYWPYFPHLFWVKSGAVLTWLSL